LGKTVDLEETRFIKFKEGGTRTTQSRLPNWVDEYEVVSPNSEGGVIYWGNAARTCHENNSGLKHGGKGWKTIAMIDAVQPPKQGSELEELVWMLERLLAPKGVSVELRKHLVDSDTNELREFDVVLTFQVGHHRVVVAIEVRDRSRPVGVNQIEEFFQKCQRKGIGSAIIVSSGGFADTARKKAAALGIRCLDFKDAETFDWLGSKDVVMAQVGLASQIAYRLFPDPAFSTAPVECEILNERGEPQSRSDLRKLVMDNIGRFAYLGPGNFSCNLQINTPSYRIKDRRSGAEHPLALIDAEFRIQVDESASTFDLRSYKEGDNVLSLVATAKIASGPIQGDLVLVRDPSGATSGGFVLKTVDPKVDMNPRPSEETTFRLDRSTESDASYK
jgi:hypothetical protein